DVETFFFVKDDDDAKRTKVLEWLVIDEDVRTHAAKRLGVAAERVRLVRVLDAGDGKPRALVIVVEVADPKVHALAFSPDGKRIAVEVNTVPAAADRVLVTKGVFLDADRLYTLHRTVRLAGQAQPGTNDTLWLDAHEGFFRLGGKVKRRDAVWLSTADD